MAYELPGITDCAQPLLALESSGKVTMKCLVLFAHPALERSRVNRRLVAGARSLEGVTVHDLYEAYPNLDIDVQREQQLLLDHDIIVVQHPLYWYATPAILKEWQDLVLEHGWAYGTEGTALRGKRLVQAVIVGGPASAYAPEGMNRFTIRQYLAPWDQTARLCGMTYLAPFVVFQTLRLATRADIAPYVEQYKRLLVALLEDRIDLELASRADCVNADLDAMLRKGD